VVQLLRDGAQARLNVAEALSEGELGEHQAQELIPAREAAGPPDARVPFDATLKRFVGSMLDYLGEDGASLIHRLSCAREGNRMSRTFAQFKSFPLR
jgi:hypothetical protein